MAIMENKYFTPDIEDIRVGYECETHQTKYDRDIPENSYDRWISISLSEENVRYLFNYNASKIGGLGLRTPYLTKEQIEAEGWERYEDGKYDNKSRKYPNIGLIYFKGKQFLSFYPELHQIEFHNNEDYSDRKTIYDGECKDINTFRYIYKLLGI